MNNKPAYMEKHSCTGCGVGYGECAQGLSMSLMCCKNCNHPTRWEPNPYTKAEMLEMWEGKEIPPAIAKAISRLRNATVQP